MNRWIRISAALLAVFMLISEPLYAQCASCRLGRKRIVYHGDAGCGQASEASCGSASGGLFAGDGLFSGRFRERRAERRERRADRRAARHEAGCGSASEASCAASEPANDIGYTDDAVPPEPTSTPVTRPADDSDGPETYDGQSTGGYSDDSHDYFFERLPDRSDVVWHPPFPLRPSRIDTPTPFDAPAREMQTAAAKAFGPFPLGAIVSPY